MCVWSLAVLALERTNSIGTVHKPPLGPASSAAGILYVTQSCFRAINRPSGPDFGRTATGKTPKSALRPAFGRRAGFGAFPVAVRPKSGPEGRFTARKHYCVTGPPAAKLPCGFVFAFVALLRNIE